MSDDPPDPSTPKDSESVKLTPAQREELRRSMDSLRDVLPKIDFPKLAIPESTLKSLSAISNLAGQQQAVLRNAMKPILASTA